ncbi:uncharacterized protein Nmag_1847 [Natrialba magadii ATCC 43099]|uniref:DUF8164 domain-containing protein n=1 Tax=Natrialba magadii (strain ATCC 43099 / DSM 3394 / CCM 3739 / CIP 104546 / IAM 13178 / JCM 8861 / NBRC 102185 / NCIMB 2190 / MS3) TaxID=547559 RepID=D3SV12_NATMM|nr:hypothetical protein [Natrialba magadii]ADD05420.1 uncharacterized protein Nmag_1847 [Natrialba magadii ATCC 43099]ELY29266.1 hypothetical protein C500_11130 [Natrialba magadii ATCC 43099]
MSEPSPETGGVSESDTAEAVEESVVEESVAAEAVEETADIGPSDTTTTDGSDGESPAHTFLPEPDPGSYSIGPLLTRSQIDADGPLEISLAIEGAGSLDDPDLDVFLRRERINPGEQIELGVFVSGCGAISADALSVFHGHDGVLDLEEPGTIRRNAAGRGGDRSQADADSRSSASDLPDPSVFQSDVDAAGGSEYGLRQKPLDGNRREVPAYILECNTRADAPPGRYSVPVVLTYRTDGGIKQVKHVQTVRVNSWHERWGPWVMWSVFAIGVLGVVSVVSELIPGF